MKRSLNRRETIVALKPLWERGVSRDRRRSRRKAENPVLSDASGYAVLLPLCGRSRDKPRSYRNRKLIERILNHCETRPMTYIRPAAGSEWRPS
ncbi:MULTISPECIES: hypothetical protein [unclassified Pseudomonas]|uniref:hypothetical protein n=1 Tax=unclassified Pseudomonas TaxID=196821 RepID=UPI0011BF9E12|nr:MULTISPECIES: hypothetical protein [unclassified Pseudomonas]